MKPTRFYSNKQEKQVAKETNGKKQINSGATPFYKGDVKNDKMLIECKTCEKEQKSFIIKREWLDTINKEAFVSRRIPVLAFNFGDDENYYIIDKKTLKLFYNLLKEENDESG